MGARPPGKRFRAPAPKAGTRRFKPTPDTDPIRAELLRIFALKATDPAAHATACKHFVEKNMGLAWAYCEALECRHVPLEDLVQVASTGLLEAIRRFDPSKAGKFSTYAVWWLKHAVGQHLKAEALVTTPDDLAGIRREIDWLERDGVRRQDYEILAHLRKKRHKKSGAPRFPGATAKDVADARALYLGHSHKQVDHRKMAAAQEDPIDAETSLALREAIAALPYRLRVVIAEEFGTGGALPPRLPPVVREHLRDLALRKLRAALSADHEP